MTEDENAKLKRLPQGSVKLIMAGDLLLGKLPNREQTNLFQRYEAVLEKLANTEREERLLNYKFLVGLMLTSHAKKCTDLSERRALFDLKNSLFFNIANNRNVRRKIGFKYLESKNFRVISYCESCTAKNAETPDLPRHKWKHCSSCEVDRKFYNVLSMFHRFDKGSATLFLSNDLISKVEGLRLPPQADKIDSFREQATFDRHHYTVRNFDIFELEGVKKAHAKLLTLS